MFAPRYFAPRYFAPRYFPPGAVVAEQVEDVIVGRGGGWDIWSDEKETRKRQERREYFDKTLSQVIRESIERQRTPPVQGPVKAEAKKATSPEIILRPIVRTPYRQKPIPIVFPPPNTRSSDARRAERIKAKQKKLREDRVRLLLLMQ